MTAPSELVFSGDELADRIGRLGDALESLASDHDALNELAESLLRGDGERSVEVLRRSIPEQLETMSDLCPLLITVVLPHAIQRGWRTATDWYQVIPPANPGEPPTLIYVTTTYSDVPEDKMREEYYQALVALGTMTFRRHLVPRLIVVPDRTAPCPSE
jgi:hypothetical protein